MSPLAAQMDQPTSPLPVFELADRQDWALRVTTRNGGVLEGRVREIASDEIRLEGGRVAMSDVARVDRGERSGSGALAGAVAGGVLGGAFTLLLMAAAHVSDGFELTIVAGVGAGAVVGGVIGAAIDPPETEWLQVWPAGEAP